MVKTVWALILALILTVSGLTACGREVVTEETGTGRIGLAMIGDGAGSKDASADAEGEAKADVLAVAVTVDDNGVIQECVIDQVPVEVRFNTEGKLMLGTETRFESKNQLGEAYGMKKASSIGKEWDEQARGFADYVKGMTLDQVLEIDLDDYGKAVDPVLLSSATIDLREFVQGVEEAVRQVK